MRSPVISTVFSLLLLMPTLVHACRCVATSGEFKSMRDLAESQIKKSTILFEGRVEQIEIQHGMPSPFPTDVLSATPSLDVLKVTVHVTRVYKGLSKDVATVLTGTGNGDCGFEFEIGKAYLVDASEDPAGRLYTSSCHATTESELAEPLLRALQKQPPAPEDLLSPREYSQKVISRRTGKICGSITYRDASLLAKNVTGNVWRILNSPVAPPKYGDLNIKPDGSFCTDPIPPGRYIVGAEDGQPGDSGARFRGYYPARAYVSQGQALEIKPGETFTNAEVALAREPVYTVHGRVVPVGADRDSSQELRVILRSTDDRLIDPDDVSIDSDGTFEFNQVTAGRYALSVMAYVEKNGRPKWQPATVDIVVPQRANEIVLSIFAAK